MACQSLTVLQVTMVNALKDVLVSQVAVVLVLVLVLVRACVNAFVICEIRYSSSCLGSWPQENISTKELIIMQILVSQDDKTSTRSDQPIVYQPLFP